VKNIFTYSILQYKHSLLLKEAINVGIIFIFHNEKQIRFVYDDTSRVRCAYPNFDAKIFNNTLRYIDKKVQKIGSSFLFDDISQSEGIRSFIHNNLLPEDATALQFSEPLNSVSISDINKTVKDFSSLLIPGIFDKIVEAPRKDEAYILRKFKKILSERDSLIEHKISTNRVIKDNRVELRFDVAWLNEGSHYVKPISFDLKERIDIQNKSTQYLGSFSLLSNYATRNKIHFDILVTSPQDENLLENYNDAIEILKAAPAPLSIISEVELPNYTEHAVFEINKHFDISDNSTT